VTAIVIGQALFRYWPAPHGT